VAIDVVSKMNLGQRAVFDKIVTAVDSDLYNAAFFLQGPTGIGKTFVYTALANLYRSRGKVVLYIASSRIAALLLPRGRISHSRFGIPINKSKEALSWFSKNSPQAGLLKEANLIIWDEVPM
jgi:Rad3-related DNA helicase